MAVLILQEKMPKLMPFYEIMLLYAENAILRIRISQQEENLSFPLHSAKPSPEILSHDPINSSSPRWYWCISDCSLIVLLPRIARNTSRTGYLCPRKSWSLIACSRPSVSSSQSELTTVAGRFLLVARLIVQGRDSCFKDITLGVVILARSLSRF